MKRLYFKPNTKVIEEGDLGDCAYIVEAGSLEVSKINDQNNKQVLGRLKENDIFGELGLIDGLPRSATVTALENCTVKVLTKEAFNSNSLLASLVRDKIEEAGIPRDAVQFIESTDRALVGVGAVGLHEAVVGWGSIVGANAVVRNGQIVPPNSMALGVPATIREGVVPEDANMVNAKVYVQRGREFRESLRRLD